MKLKIVASGKIRERYLAEGIEDYARRIRRYAELEIREVPDEPNPGQGEAREAIAREREGERILEALPAEAVVIALDPQGEEWSSTELAERLAKWELSGPYTVAFAIGGELGLSPKVLACATHVLSLSRMTFPHQLARLLLLEQLYRAFRIHRGEPYHR